MSEKWAKLKPPPGAKWCDGCREWDCICPPSPAPKRMEDKEFEYMSRWLDHEQKVGVGYGYEFDIAIAYRDEARLARESETYWREEWEKELAKNGKLREAEAQWRADFEVANQDRHENEQLRARIAELEAEYRTANTLVGEYMAEAQMAQKRLAELEGNPGKTRFCAQCEAYARRIEDLEYRLLPPLSKRSLLKEASDE
jgi:BMFP domain-containing protein YqiC